MTVRSVLLGLLGAATICGFSFLNDRVLRGTFLVGNNMPVSVYGLLILFVMFANPLLRRMALRGREIAVILALTLAACCIPGAGLLRTFTSSLVLPHHYKRVEPGWKQGGPTEISERDVRDREGLVALLQKAALRDSDEADPCRGVWRRLPGELQARLRVASEADARRGDLQASIIDALNAILADRSFARAEAFVGLELPGGVRGLAAKSGPHRRPRHAERDPATLTEKEVSDLNRALLDALFEGYLTPRRAGVVERLPEKMLADVSRNEDEVLGGFVQGMGRADRHISLGEVPWYAWTRTLLFWLPVVLALWGALIGLSLVIHRQWSQHEHLPYPVATFTDSLLPPDRIDDRTGAGPHHLEARPAGTGGSTTSLFRNRLFWMSTLGVLVIYLNNYSFLWFHEYLVRIPTSFDLSSLKELFPTFVRGGGAGLLRPTIYFTVVGIAYLIPKDVSLAFGAGPFLWALFVGTLATFGITISGVVEGSSGYIGLKPSTFLLFGANLGVFFFVLYTGRRHYLTVLRWSLGGRPSMGNGGSTADEAQASEVWGCRAFLVLMTLFVLQVAFLAGVGLGLAVLYAAVLIVFYVVMSRLISESGLFYIQPYFFPCVVLWGLFGARAIGPRTLLVMQMLTVVLVIDPRESLMPFMVNSLRLIELRQTSAGRPGLGRASAFAVLAIVLGLAIALPVTLYVQYDQGGAIWEGWAERSVPKMPFMNAIAVEQRLAAQGLYEGGAARETGASGTSWLGRVSPNATCVWLMLAGLAAVLLFSAARLHFNWWPLHPLLFVTWATYPARLICGAFLLGWFIKAVVMKYGGSHVHNRLKPIMIGLIAGEVLGGVIPSIASAIYYFATGLPPKAFHVLPT